MKIPVVLERLCFGEGFQAAFKVALVDVLVTRMACSDVPFEVVEANPHRAMLTERSLLTAFSPRLLLLLEMGPNDVATKRVFHVKLHATHVALEALLAMS